MRWQTRPPWFLIAALAAAFILAWPVLSEPGLLNTRGGGDSPFLLQRLHQLETAVRDGHFPVRWMPDANYGLGYPFYNFYAPLSLYIAGFFRLFGFSFVRAIHLAQLAGFVTAVVGMFYLARRWFNNEWAGFLAAVAYSAAPFHMVNVYVRGDSLAEFWAMAFYPLILLAVDGVFAAPTKQKRWTAVGLLALAYAALILSHNISALIFSPFLLLYILLRLVSRLKSSAKMANEGAAVQDASPTDYRSLFTDYCVPFTVGLLFAFALAAWFFLPALVEKDLAQLGPVTEGYFHFSNHFLGADERPLLQSSFFFDYAVDGREAFRMGFVQTVGIVAGVILLLAGWKRPAWPQPDRRLFILLSLFISTFMLLPWANWLWENLPLLSFTQFPWRFLSVQAFVGALATAALALLPWRRLIVPITAILLMTASLGNLQTDHLLLTDADVTDERLAQYEWFSGNIGTTVSAEYLPYNVQPRFWTSRWLTDDERHSVQALTGDLLEARPLTEKTTYQKWLIDVEETETDERVTLIFPTLFWSGWQAWADDEPITLRPSPGSGQLMLELPSGEAIVELRLKRTPMRLAAEIVSLTAVFLLIGLFFKTVNRPQNRTWIAIAVSLIVLLLLGQLEPKQTLSQNTLNWDFAQMAYLSHAPDGIPFSSGAVLENYEFEAESVGAGESITISTQWTNGEQTAVTLQLTTPASNRFQTPSPPVLAEQTQPIENGRATFQLTVPDDVPAGLVMPRLLLADGQALTPSGQERGELFLRPLSIENNDLRFDTFSHVDVQAQDVIQRDETTLDIHLVWYTEAPLSHNYNVALRLTDKNGQFLQLADMQPGYGFQPSSTWAAGEGTADWLALTLPGGEHETPYILLAQLIDITQPNAPVLTRKLGELWPDGQALTFQPPEPAFVLPNDMQVQTAVVFSDTIGLASYSIDQSPETVRLRLIWESLLKTDVDYTRFAHLIPVSGPPQVAQVDNMPQHGTYPTSQWIELEVVEDMITFNLADLPAGDYQLAVGFYELLLDGTDVRLTAVAENGSPLPNNQYLIPEIITIP